ncbi:MAG: phage major capsid protein [Clostridia bacterium]|nr:phage major capsid protein [Clostridia bacterium]
MITVTTADSALKSFYLDAVVDALNIEANPFLAQIEKSTSDVVGKDVRRVVRYGVNGGVNAGTEAGALPAASDGNYAQFVLPLKNLYGTIEISDKALRASNGDGAFVNLLNEEMNSLIKSASYNLGRMLYGDGSGKLGTVSAYANNVLTLDSVKAIAEGIIVDVYDKSGAIVQAASGRKVVSIDRAAKKITLGGATIPTDAIASGYSIYVQGSKDNEITGLKAIFSDADIYGNSRAGKNWLKPYMMNEVGAIDELTVQTAIDEIEEASGSKIDFIVCSWGVKRALAKHFKDTSVNVQMVEIKGGYKAMSFNGIPVVADRFCPEGTMYLLNSKDFKLHQLCDWQWLEGEDGKVLKQVPGTPVFAATLVKYAELLCDRPCGQGMLSGIIEA